MKKYNSFNVVPLFAYTGHNCGCCGKYVGELSQVELDAIAHGEITGYCDECEFLRCPQCGSEALSRGQAAWLATRASCLDCVIENQKLPRSEREFLDDENWGVMGERKASYDGNPLQAWYNRDIDIVNRKDYRKKAYEFES